MVDPDHLEVIENEYPGRNTRLEVISPEFTCLCPGNRDQPDFGTVIIEYVPDDFIIELKSLKQYLTSYRDTEIYHEPATNLVLEHLVTISEPRWMRVTGQFNVRGGITTDVIVEHGQLTDDMPEPGKTRSERLTRIPSEK